MIQKQTVSIVSSSFDTIQFKKIKSKGEYDYEII